MKKAEQYLKEYVGRRYPNTDYNSEEVDIMEAIKQAQIDAIEETCRICAEKATGSVYNIPGPGDLKRVSINKQSILNCAEILKKQL